MKITAITIRPISTIKFSSIAGKIFLIIPISSLDKKIKARPAISTSNVRSNLNSSFPLNGDVMIPNKKTMMNIMVAYGKI